LNGLGNTGEGYGAESDSSFNEDEAEEREALRLQQKQLELIQEEDFVDSFTLPSQQSQPKVRVVLWIRISKDPEHKLTLLVTKIIQKWIRTKTR
jgi:ribosomal protein S8